MTSKLVNGNTLVFKLTDKGEIGNIEFEGIVVNFVADLSDVNIDVIKSIKNNLIKFGQSIYNNKGSFVIVCDISFSDELNIVPTIQEAFDFIEMEEIERKLDF